MTPGEAIRSLLDKKGWTQEELAYIMGRSRKTVMDLMAARTGITPETAVALGKAFGNDPEEWMRLQTEYQLSLAKEAIPDGIELRAKLYDIAPISDMQRRGWISETRDPAELEHELKSFFDNADSSSQCIISTTV
jgi:HTH-type transcriptional regulator/antitoxin HigA